MLGSADSRRFPLIPTGPAVGISRGDQPCECRVRGDGTAAFSGAPLRPIVGLIGNETVQGFLDEIT